ncbi:sigma-70 family RNA polymerase sigma factor [Flammeovirgaceae bacterium 311]|nr:sigma-70 family RNA polymerase sigma factor [Flammeovirgaceae bacterium 311]
MITKTILDHTDDASLLANVKRGCEHSFNVLYEKYWQQAYNNAYKRLKDADQAKDVVQEIFVHIWLKKENHIDNFPAYLSVAVRNRVFKLVEKQKKTSPFLQLLHDVPAAQVQTEAAVLRKEFFKGYESLLNTLPVKRQRIFRLRFNEDLTTKAIAAMLGLSRKTVQNQIGKAIEQIRVSLLQL